MIIIINISSTVEHEVADGGVRRCGVCTSSARRDHS